MIEKQRRDELRRLWAVSSKEHGGHHDRGEWLAVPPILDALDELEQELHRAGDLGTAANVRAETAERQLAAANVALDRERSIRATLDDENERKERLIAELQEKLQEAEDRIEDPNQNMEREIERLESDLADAQGEARRHIEECVRLRDRVASLEQLLQEDPCP